MKHGKLGVVLVLMALVGIACGAQPPQISQEALDQAQTAIAENTTPQAEDAQQDAADDVACGFDSAFVAHVTVPDGTQLALGSQFTKTWTVSNTGCAEWPSGLQAVFVSGNQMGGPATIALESATAPGASRDITVDFVVPDSPGAYQANYQLITPDAELFGAEFHVQIEAVGGGGPGDNSGGGGDDGGSTGGTDGGTTAGATTGGGDLAAPTTGGDDAPPADSSAGGGDIAAPDTGSTGGSTSGGDLAAPTTTGGTTGGTTIGVITICQYKWSLVERVNETVPVKAGQVFIKQYVFYNSGNCAWPEGSELYLVSGPALTTTNPIVIPSEFLPDAGENTTISIVGTAPGPGQYTMSFRFRDNLDNDFTGPPTQWSMTITVIQ